jgi:C1A family cysteine protease
MSRKLNCIRDTQPSAHLAFQMHSGYRSALSLVPAVSRVDLRSSIMPPIVDQGQEGSCPANAMAYMLGGIQIKDIKGKLKSDLEFDPDLFFPYARQFGYYVDRVLMNTVNEDSGSTLSIAFRAAQQFGACREITWPYSNSMYQKPSNEAYAEASLHKPLTGYALDNTDLNQLKACLLAGYPFVFGMEICSNFFETGSNGIVSLPSGTVAGAHAMSVFGYDDNLNGGSFIVPNSWGVGWADKGVCYIPFSMLTCSIAWDFLTARG